MMAQAPSEPPQGGNARRARLLLAAILVIGLLAVISVLLFNRSSKGNEPQPTPRPISITLSSCADQPMSVLVDLCTHHQLTDLLQSRTMGQYLLVLERAYLDMNQFLMTYRVFSHSTGQQTPADMFDVLVTTSQGLSFRPSTGESNSTGPAVIQFSTPPVPASTDTLQFQVEVNALHFPILKLPPSGTPLPQPSVVHGSATFDFTLPYHGGLVVTPRQTVTVKALSVTLERVRISPSETSIEGTTKGLFPNTSADIYTFSLDAAGRSPSFSPEGLGGDHTTDTNPFTEVINDGLLGQHGLWTFKISYVTGLEGPWVFHFRVP
jgi:hypothetical protein